MHICAIKNIYSYKKIKMYVEEKKIPIYIIPIPKLCLTWHLASAHTGSIDPTGGVGSQTDNIYHIYHWGHLLPLAGAFTYYSFNITLQHPSQHYTCQILNKLQCISDPVPTVPKLIVTRGKDYHNDLLKLLFVPHAKLFVRLGKQCISHLGYVAKVWCYITCMLCFGFPCVPFTMSAVISSHGS